MNYNNFKRHDYVINWHALRDRKTKELNGILLLVSRDEGYPFGEKVEDKFELKFALKVNSIDADSLIPIEDEPGWYIIKKDSIEWNKYEAEPGIPYNDFMRNMREEKMAELIRAEIKKETGGEVIVGMSDGHSDFRFY